MVLETLHDRINVLHLDHNSSKDSRTQSVAGLLFESLSYYTWQRLKYSIPMNVSQGEETITDINLLEMKLSGIRDIKVWKCSKKEESTKGIDWWWLIGNDIAGWRSYLVQAKKLNLKTKRYSTLSHKVGNQRQIDCLVETARIECAFPLYCFYNYVDFPTKDALPEVWNCRSLQPEETQLGCTVTPARIVEAALSGSKRENARTFESIHFKGGPTTPWRCLVTCDHAVHAYQAPENVPHECDSAYMYSKYVDIPVKARRLFEPSDGEIVTKLDATVPAKRVAIIEVRALYKDRTSMMNQAQPPLPEMKNF